LFLPSAAWELVIQELEEGVVVFDRDLRILDANRAAFRLLGLRTIKGFRGVMEHLLKPEIAKLVFSGVEVLNIPLDWESPDEEGRSFLRSFIPIIPEGEDEVKEVVLLLKPRSAPAASPEESWLEWGRKYIIQVTSNLQEAICYLDREGRIIYANRTFEDIAGSRLRDMTGKSLPSVLKPVSRPLFLMEVIEKTMKEGSWRGEIEIQTGFGKRALLATAAAVRSEERLYLGMAMLARDITDRKQLEDDIQRRSRELNLVYDLLQLTTGYHEMEDSLGDLLSRILSIMRAEAGAVYLLDQETDKLRLAAYQGLAYRSAKGLASEKEGMELTGGVMAGSGGVIVEKKADQEGSYTLWGPRGPLLSLAAAPISARNRAVGVLMVGHKKSSHFGEADLSVLLSLATQVGVVFELTGLLEDLHERLEELGNERDFTRALVDTMPSALALLDNRGRFIYINQQFTELLGFRPDEVEGRPFSSFLPKGERRETMQNILTREGAVSAWREIELIDRWGEMVPVLITSAPRPFEGGEYNGAIVTITDLSRQRAKEREALEIGEAAEALNRELAGALDSLEHLDFRKQAYLSMVHHEIAAPIRLIGKEIRYLDSSLADIPREEAAARLKLLALEVDHLERLASDIRDVSAAERGKLRLRRRELDLREVTSRAVEEMHLASDNPIVVELPARAVTGRVDAGRLEQVLTSLIDNAIKFSPSRSEITIRLTREKGQVIWEVVDKGSGMDSQQMQDLLDLFAGRGRPEREIREGLGLYICHHIIQAHGGDLFLESAPGRGTKVIFTIPLKGKR
jgi:PAS domain S-box-containing protein